MGKRGKYGPLHDWLNRQPESAARVECTFRQIEEMIGEALPPSARSSAIVSWWWGNDATHTQAQAWLRAGWRTRGVDLGNERITFVRAVSS